MSWCPSQACDTDTIDVGEGEAGVRDKGAEQEQRLYVDLSSIRIEKGDPADFATPERAAELVTTLLERSP